MSWLSHAIRHPSSVLNPTHLYSSAMHASGRLTHRIANHIPSWMPEDLRNYFAPALNPTFTLLGGRGFQDYYANRERGLEPTDARQAAQGNAIASGALIAAGAAAGAAGGGAAGGGASTAGTAGTEAGVAGGAVAGGAEAGAAIPSLGTVTGASAPAGTSLASGVTAGGAAAGGSALGGYGQLAGTVVNAGVGLYNSHQQAQAAEEAARLQAEAAGAARGESARQYDLTRADYLPFREAGYEALDQQRAGLQPGGEFNRDFTLADFAADPGRAFRMQEGERALQRTQAATTGTLNGGAVKEALRFNSGLASQEYGAAWDRFQAERTGRFNRLSAVAGTGQTALNTVANAGENNVARQTEALYGAANARAAGTIGAANARAAGAAGIGNAVQDYFAYQNYGRG